MYYKNYIIMIMNYKEKSFFKLNMMYENLILNVYKWVIKKFNFKVITIKMYYYNLFKEIME